jgi:hypothetical protein
MVVSLIVNHEEHLQTKTGSRNSIILEVYSSAKYIKKDDSNTTTWNTMDNKFTTSKTGKFL